ncbi:MAG: hypothetical protein QHJ73_06560 [Armatimonadota bacterium]|nr:hypothetical protein [Armatimonadota bacterium]
MASNDAETSEGRVVDQAEAAPEANAEASVPESAGEAPSPGEENTAPGAASAEEARPPARRYRPVENYVEGERILHPVWNVEGTVRYREPRERVFRVSLGRAEERGRCHKIVVEFDEAVPTAQGPRREVALIADWHGRPFEVGEPVAPQTEPEVLFARTPDAERPASRVPVLPDIPEPEPVEEEDEEEEQEVPGAPPFVDADEEAEEDVEDEEDEEEEEDGEEELRPDPLF